MQLDGEIVAIPAALTPDSLSLRRLDNDEVMAVCNFSKIAANYSS